MHDAEVFQYFGDAHVGVEELRRALGGFFFAGQFQRNIGHDAQKSAVHHDAVGQVEDEVFLAARGEFVNEAAEVDAGGKGGASADLDADDAVEDRHHQICARSVHCAYTHGRLLLLVGCLVSIRGLKMGVKERDLIKYEGGKRRTSNEIPPFPKPADVPNFGLKSISGTWWNASLPGKILGTMDDLD